MSTLRQKPVFRSLQGRLNRRVFPEISDIEARGIEHFEDLMILRNCLAKDSAYTRFAVRNKKVIGLASGCRLMNGSFIIRGFAVEKTMRNRGIGAALVSDFAKGVSKWFHGPLFCCVRDDNSALAIQKTLRKAGFRVFAPRIFSEYFKQEPTEFFEKRYIGTRSKF